MHAIVSHAKTLLHAKTADQGHHAFESSYTNIDNIMRLFVGSGG